MTNAILCVDDEPAILDAFRRNFRKKYIVVTADNAQEALQALDEKGPFAVVVSDLKMPGMDGITLLAKAREKAPDTVRIMLTGNADLDVAVRAVNQGNIFQFLTKPCDPEMMLAALDNAVRQHHLVIAERELLEETLNGSVRVLIDILSRLDPDSFGFGQKIRTYLVRTLKTLDIQETWHYEMAALLCRLGNVTIPESVRRKAASNIGLTGEEKDMLARVPQFGHDLLAQIPRLDTVAEAILYQNRHYSGGGFPVKGPVEKSLPLGGRLINILGELVRLESRGYSKYKALQSMRLEKGIYDPDLLDVALKSFELDEESLPPAERPHRKIALKQLRIGDILLSDIVTEDEGITILAAGTPITQMPLALIHNFARINGIREPILVALEDESKPRYK